MLDQLGVVDLFCGAGGLSLGFRRAGFLTVAAFDSWKPAIITYAQNLDANAKEGAVDESVVLPKADVFVGGPPCQGFSSAGLRRQDDHRNTLVGVFARLVAHHRPRAFVFENVEGFLTGNSGSHVFELIDPLIEAGYWVRLEKVNAANYGVPQHRKRVIAIGGLGWEPTFPTPSHSAFGAPGADLAGVGLPRTPCFDDAMLGLPLAKPLCEVSMVGDHGYTPYNQQDQERATFLKPGQSMRDLPEHLWHPSYRKRAFRRVSDGTPTEKRGGAPSGLRRLKGDEPSKAITGGALNEFVHPREHRPLTMRECARLQTFPDDFRFIGTVREQIQLLGNAVPPLLAQRFAESLRADLLSQVDRISEGKLVSFVPTHSNGMSPVLAKVSRDVRTKYHDVETKQLSLAWD